MARNGGALFAAIEPHSYDGPISWPHNACNHSQYFEDMGFINRIHSKHTLHQAIAIKINQKDVSDKTLSKLAEKIHSLGNVADSPRLSKLLQTVPAKSQKPMATSLQTEIRKVIMLECASRLTNVPRPTPGQSKMQQLLQCNLADSAIGLARADLEANRQPSSIANIADDALMSAMVDAERARRPGLDLHALRSTDELASLIMSKSGPWRGQAVVKMARAAEQNESHFSAVDLRVEKDGSRLLIVYESAFLQGDKRAGSDHGFDSLLDAMKQSAGRGKTLPRIGFVEMSTQKSPGDCAIFSLNTALQCAKRPDISNPFVQHIKSADKNIVYFYDKSGAQYIANKDKKTGVALPPTLHKHGHSLSALRNLDSTPVNRRQESAASRGERHRVEREGRSYSNSIELKRLTYYNRTRDAIKLKS